MVPYGRTYGTHMVIVPYGFNKSCITSHMSYVYDRTLWSPYGAHMEPIWGYRYMGFITPAYDLSLWEGDVK